MATLDDFIKTTLERMLIMDVKLFNVMVAKELNQRAAISKWVEQPSFEAIIEVNAAGVPRLKAAVLQSILEHTKPETLSELLIQGEKVLAVREEKLGIRPPPRFTFLQQSSQEPEKTIPKGKPSSKL